MSIDPSAAAEAILVLRRQGVTAREPWELAVEDFRRAVAGCDDPVSLEAVLVADSQSDLPIDAKSEAYERLLSIGPRSPRVLRAYAQHLWLHGPAHDELARALEAEATSRSSNASDP